MPEDRLVHEALERSTVIPLLSALLLTCRVFINKGHLKSHHQGYGVKVDVDIAWAMSI